MIKPKAEAARLECETQPKDHTGNKTTKRLDVISGLFLS
ncbi:hypothetical protein B4083_1757 [Bacillus cereus]|nr:hypothetical protein B4083_1757 [Bacillus cereus]